MFLSSSAQVHVRQKHKQSSAVTTVQACVMNYGVRCHGLFRSVRMLHTLFQRCACAVTRTVFVRAHACVLQKQRVRGHSVASGDILIEPGVRSYQCVAQISGS